MSNDFFDELDTLLLDIGDRHSMDAVSMRPKLKTIRKVVSFLEASENFRPSSVLGFSATVEGDMNAVCVYITGNGYSLSFGCAEEGHIVSRFDYSSDTFNPVFSTKGMEARIFCDVIDKLLAGTRGTTKRFKFDVTKHMSGFSQYSGDMVLDKEGMVTATFYTTDDEVFVRVLVNNRELFEDQSDLRDVLPVVTANEILGGLLDEDKLNDFIEESEEELKRLKLSVRKMKELVSESR